MTMGQRYVYAKPPFLTYEQCQPIGVIFNYNSFILGIIVIVRNEFITLLSKHTLE